MFKHYTMLGRDSLDHVLFYLKEKQICIHSYLTQYMFFYKFGETK